MLRLYSFSSAKREIDREMPFICQTEEKYGVPASWIQAILLKEMTGLNILDPLADLAVRAYYLHYRLTGRELRPGFHVLRKKDSSTGWAQIYAFVAINALNFASERGIASYADFGLDPNHRLDADCPGDRWLIWQRLNQDRHFNIEMCALNLLACAEERNGNTDVHSFSPEETKLTFTRYNSTIPSITAYGETTYRYHQEYMNHRI